jgi:hypothetical protein
MEKFGFNNVLNLKHFDSNGNLIREWTCVNRTQTETINKICDMFDSFTQSSCSFVGMAIGTGDNQNAAATALATKVSDETLAGGDVTDNDTNVVAIKTFTNASAGSWTIQEAGIFGETGCADHMLFYACNTNDSLNEVLGIGDTLQITWTVTPADN